MNPNIYMKEITQTVEWALIKAFYGDRVAERSRQPLMNHINEGLALLAAMDADDVCMRGFIVHPLVQVKGPENDLEPVYLGMDLLDSWHMACGMKRLNIQLTHIRHGSRNKGQMPRHWGTHYEAAFNTLPKANPLMSKCILQMILADKQQNLKDLHFHMWGRITDAEHLEEHLECVIDRAETLIAAADRVLKPRPLEC